jgi:IS30 family transposase
MCCDEKIKEIYSKLNNHPRKRFGNENPIIRMEKLFNLEIGLVACIQ